MEQGHTYGTHSPKGRSITRQPKLGAHPTQLMPTLWTHPPPINMPHLGHTHLGQPHPIGTPSPRHAHLPCAHCTHQAHPYSCPTPRHTQPWDTPTSHGTHPKRTTAHGHVLPTQEMHPTVTEKHDCHTWHTWSSHGRWQLDSQTFLNAIRNMRP